MSALPTVPTLLIFVAALLGLAWGLAGLVVQAVAYRGLRAEWPYGTRSSHAQVRRLRLNTVLLTLITLVAALLLVSCWPW